MPRSSIGHASGSPVRAMITNRNPRLLSTALARHLSRHTGKVAHVYHCPGPQIIHADVLHIAPTSRRRRHILVSCGMSARPMCPPDEMPEARYAELFLSLPAEWPMGGDSHAGWRVAWPIHALGDLARLPHREEGWLWEHHTIGAPDPEEEIAPGVGFTAWILGSFGCLGYRTRRADILGAPLSLFSAIPIYPEELDLARTRGTYVLFNRMRREGIDDLVRIGRPNLAVRKR